MKNDLKPGTTPHLSIVATTNDGGRTGLTRAQVAKRIGASTSTVRRYEGDQLHPRVDKDGTHWFDPREVTALAALRANRAISRGTLRNAKPATEARTRGELAALVFERLEQRQSLAEIVIGVRVEPQTVHELFEAWCLGLTEAQLLSAREPHVPRESDVQSVKSATLAARLGELPDAQATRISVARSRGAYLSGDNFYADVVELGGFHVSGPCRVDEITSRYGHGDYRITAYGFDPPGVRWELMVEGL